MLIILFPTATMSYGAHLPKLLWSCYSPGQSSDFIVQRVNSTAQHGSFSDSLHADISLDGSMAPKNQGTVADKKEMAVFMFSKDGKTRDADMDNG